MVVARDQEMPSAQKGSWDHPPSPSGQMGCAAVMQLGGVGRRCTSPTDWPATPGLWSCPPGSCCHSGASSQSSQPAGRGPGTWTEREQGGTSRKSSQLSPGWPVWWCQRSEAASGCNHTKCPDRAAGAEPESHQSTISDSNREINRLMCLEHGSVTIT